MHVTGEGVRKRRKRVHHKPCAARRIRDIKVEVGQERRVSDWRILKFLTSRNLSVALE